MDIIDGASPTSTLKRKKDPRIEQQTAMGQLFSYHDLPTKQYSNRTMEITRDRALVGMCVLHSSPFDELN